MSDYEHILLFKSIRLPPFYFLIKIKVKSGKYDTPLLLNSESVSSRQLIFSSNLQTLEFMLHD